MNKDQIITRLTEWKDRITESDQIIEKYLEPLQLSPESPLYQAIWSLQGGYTKAVAEIVGDEWEWLDWYCAENDMGDSGRTACPGKGFETRRIDGLDALAQLILESI